MLPPYNPLVVKAISAGFRAIGCRDRQNFPDLTYIHIDHVKQRYESNKLRRFERVRYSARHRAARKRPASMKSAESGTFSPRLVPQWYYMTMAWRSILEKF